MSQDNASFTFLHRIEEVELNSEDGRWQSALALVLTLPDICGGIAFPEIVKRYRDGRAVLDRNQRPTRDVGNQYIRWFDTYAAPFFKVSALDISPYICGERCWQLRCEYLHQNKGFARHQWYLQVPCGQSPALHHPCQILDQTIHPKPKVTLHHLVCRQCCTCIG